MNKQQLHFKLHTQLNFKMMNYGYHYDDEPNSNGGVIVKVLS